MVALFTEDAEWAAPEGVAEGKQRCLIHFGAREDQRGRKSKHICTNFWLEDVSETGKWRRLYHLIPDDGDPDRARE